MSDCYDCQQFALLRTLCKYLSIYRFADLSKFVWRATISLRSSPIRFAIARLEESLVTEIPVTNNSTRPEEASKTFTISEPSEFKVQVQESGRNPHSTIWRSSSVDIIRSFILGSKPINGCFAVCGLTSLRIVVTEKSRIKHQRA